MTKEDLNRGEANLRKDLETVFMAIPKAKRSTLLPAMNSVEAAGKLGIAAIWLLSDLWMIIGSQARSEYAYADQVAALLAKIG